MEGAEDGPRDRSGEQGKKIAGTKRSLPRAIEEDQGWEDEKKERRKEEELGGHGFNVGRRRRWLIEREAEDLGEC